MKKNRIWERFIVLLLFVTAWVVPSVADVCVYKPPSVRLVAGIVVDSSGRPIPGVNVAIIQSGESVASATTDDTGKFRFDWLREGAYELATKANGFQRARYKVLLSRPSKHWNRSLQIELAVGVEHCGGDIKIVKTR